MNLLEHVILPLSGALCARRNKLTDIANIGAVLGSIKAATDIAKIIKDSASSLEQAEINYKISELVGSLAEAKLEMAEIQNILLEKDKHIAELEAFLETQNSVFYEGRSYWVDLDDAKDGPFCQRCYDTEKKLVRLQSGFRRYGGKNIPIEHCAACDTQYSA